MTDPILQSSQRKRVFFLGAIILVTISFLACDREPKVSVAELEALQERENRVLQEARELEASAGPPEREPGAVAQLLGPGTPEQDQMMMAAKMAFLADEYESAERAFTALAAMEPTTGTTVSAAIALGQIYMETDRKEEAAKLYEELATEVPDVAEVMLVVARAWASLGETTRALKAYQRTLELQPAFVFAHAEMGSLYTKAGREADAAKAFYQYEQKVYGMATRLENKDSSAEERLQIVDAFALIDDDRANQALLKAVNDPHPNVRLNAVIALGDMNLVGVVDELKRVAIEDPEMRVRMAARVSLQSVNEAEAAGLPPEEGTAPTIVDSPDDLPVPGN